MKKSFFLPYGVICYLAYFGTILYAIGFVDNIIGPKTIEGEQQIPLFQAILINAS